MNAQPNRQDGDPPPTGTKASTLRGSTLIVTNLTKLVGLAVFVREAIQPASQRDELILAMCLVFVSGWQMLENVLLRLVDRIFGGD